MPDVYQQAFALMEALWQPLIEHGVIERATAPQLSKWIEAHVGASFPPNPDEPARRHAYKAYHAWDDYRRGALDAYFWGEATEAAEHDPNATADPAPSGEPAPDAPAPGLAQLLPRDLFDELCRLLSTTRDARIPEQPYASFGDYAKGLWFYGLHQLDGLDAKKRPQLTDQFCQRGIGPKGELILRSRPFGGITLDATDLDGFRGSSETRELLAQATTTDNLIEKRLAFLGRYSNVAGWNNAHFNEEYFWHRQYKENRLDTLFDTRQLGSQTSTGDGMRTGLRLALDFAVCLPFAIVCEVEKRLGERRLNTGQICDELRDALLAAEVRGAHDKPGTGAPLLEPEERTELATVYSWPSTPCGYAAVVTCALVRLLLGRAHAAGRALADHLDELSGGTARATASRAQHYLAGVAAWGEMLDMRGTAGDQASYEELYVPPAFHMQQSLSGTGRRRCPGARSDLSTAENPAAILAYLAEEDERRGTARLLIQAGSGMGKTTYVKGLAAGIAQARTAGDATLFSLIAGDARGVPLMDWTPVLIAQPEADLAGSGFEALAKDAPPLDADAFACLLYRQLPDTLKDPFRAAAADDETEARGLFIELLKSRDALVIVDSIDEVPLEVRRRYIEQLTALVNAYRIRHLIVTSRPLEGESEALVEQLVRGTIVALEPFDLPRQRALFGRLVEAFAEPGSTSDDTDDLASPLGFDAIAETPGFGDIVANPLVLTALVRALLRTSPRNGTTAFAVLDELAALLPKLPNQDLYGYDEQVLERIAFELTCGILTDPAQTQTGDGLPVQTFVSTYATYEDEARGGTTDDNTKQADVIDRMVTRRGVLAVHEGCVSFESPLMRALFAARHVLASLGSYAAQKTDELSQKIGQQIGSLLNAGVRTVAAEATTRADPTASPDPAPAYALLLILSARNPRYQSMQSVIYRSLCNTVLFDVSELQCEHDFAVRMLRAARRFDFGRPCPRAPEVELWEARLTDLSA